MPDELFWRLIEEAKSTAGDDIETQAEKLTAFLAQRSADEIVDFAKTFDACMARSYSWDLWAAAYIINGGCSDDGFDYFRGWLIAQGRKVFEDALRDPETLVERADPEADGEPMLYVADNAYRRKTGNDFPEYVRTVASHPSGKEWAEEAVNDVFPRLAARFS
jgi:hypothetical protein